MLACAVFWFVAVVGADPALASSQDGAVALEKEISAQIPKLIAKTKTPGFAVAFSEGGRPVYAHGFGYANRARRIPVTADTLFNMASVSKLATAVGILHLAESRHISLDTPVSDVPV